LTTQESESSLREPIVESSPSETEVRTKLRKPLLYAHQTFASSHCEICGSYETVVTEVYLNRVKIFHEYSDGHLSPGHDFIDIGHLKPLFEALGYEFYYTKESDATDD
jgi:hypothetical protein